MKNVKFIFLLGLVGLTAVACKGKGDFETDRSTYNQGDQIFITNTTEKATTFYFWEFGGVSVSGENPVYNIPWNQPAGSMTIQLTPTNNEGVVTNFKTTTKTVTVVEVNKAKIVVHFTGSFLSNATVTYQGNSKVLFAVNDPIDCETVEEGDNIMVIDEIPAGEYLFTVRSVVDQVEKEFPLTITVDTGLDCVLVDIADHL